jgi:hypothetical protein
MKGIAVETIIKVALLVLVLSFVVYWIIKAVGNPGTSIEQCRFLFMDWCKNCVLKGWNGALPWSDDLLRCMNKYATVIGIKTPITYAGGCSLVDARNQCAKFGIT